MGDDHEPEVLEHRPPDGMLVLHGRIFRDPARLSLRIQVAKLIQQFCGKSTSSQGFLLVLFFFYCFIKIAEETPFFHILANIEFCHYWIVKGWISLCRLVKWVVPENIRTTPTEGICRMTLPSLWIFQNQPPKCTPCPLRNFQSFPHPLELYKQIPYANSMCSSHKEILWVSCIFCWILQQISEFLMCSQSSREEIVEQVLSHTQMKCMGNIMVLFSHCINKKATLEEV